MVKTLKETPLDNVKIALDHVYDKGLADELNQHNLARLLKVPRNEDLIDTLITKLPNIYLKRPAGPRTMTVHLFSRPALEEFCTFLGLDKLAYVEDYTVPPEDYCAFISPELAKKAALKIIEIKPYFFEGILTGKDHASRRIIRYLSFPTEARIALTEIIPFVDMKNKGVVFHLNGIRAVLKECLKLVSEKYGLDTSQIDVNTYLRRV